MLRVTLERETGWMLSVFRPKHSHVSAVGHAGLFYGAIQTLTAITLQAEVMQASSTFADKCKTHSHCSDSVTVPMSERRKITADFTL